MDKLGRNYRLFVDAANGERLEIAPPFSVEFEINRNTLASSSTANFRIYNLREETRNAIAYNVIDFTSPRKIELWAGYGDDRPLIFRGTLSYCWSAREGVNFITTIEAYDSGFELLTSSVSQSYRAGTLTSSVIEDMINTMAPGVPVGAIGSFNTPLTKGIALKGNTGDLLNEFTGGAFFCDLGKAYVLKDQECIRGSIALIESDTGLLGTPIRERTIINFDMLFEPRLLIGQLLRLNSSTGKNLNGDYKVVSLKHRGMISDAVCGSAVTSVGLWGGLAFTVIN